MDFLLNQVPMYPMCFPVLVLVGFDWHELV
jgi:hypothetical protein